MPTPDDEVPQPDAVVGGTWPRTTAEESAILNMVARSRGWDFAKRNPV
jgi:hypothetical protein